MEGVSLMWTRYGRHAISSFSGRADTLKTVLLHQRFCHGHPCNLSERGLWIDCFPQACRKFEEELKQDKNPRTFYSGFDPTGDSLHVGHLAVLNALLHCHSAGHQIIALIGGATGQVGDPTGRSTQRPLLRSEILKANSSAVTENILRIFSNYERFFCKNSRKFSMRVINNATWYDRMTLPQMLHKAGQHIKMKGLMNRTSVSDRLNSKHGMALREFWYQTLQAYDWLHLFDKYNCTVQIGGNDQMGNIWTGHDLLSQARNVSVTGLTVPLLTTSSGQKLGKSAGNAVWLTDSKTSPGELYQYFLQREHSEVDMLLKVLTLLPLDEIEDIMLKHQEVPDLCYAQRVLAEKVVLLVHGEEGLCSVLSTAQTSLSSKMEMLERMTPGDITAVLKDVPILCLKYASDLTVQQLISEVPILSADKVLEVASARLLFINDICVTEATTRIDPSSHIYPSGLTVLKLGNDLYIIKWIS